MVRSEIDQELRDIATRREQARDLLLRCLIEIDSGRERENVLLDRKLTQ